MFYKYYSFILKIIFKKKKLGVVPHDILQLTLS